MRMYFTLGAGREVPDGSTVYTDYIQFTSNGKSYVFDVLEVDYQVKDNKMDARIKNFALLSIDDDVVDKEATNEEFVEILKGMDTSTLVIGAFFPDEQFESLDVDLTGEYSVKFEWSDFNLEFTGKNNP